MDPVLLYIKLEPYVAQWFIHEMGGEPVKLPKRSSESDIIEYFLAPTPNNAVANLKEDGDIAIVIPTFKHKDPTYFNYLAPKAMAALARCITVRFRVQVWQDLHKCCFLTFFLFGKPWRPVKHWHKLAKIVSRICPGLFKNKTQLIDRQFIGLCGPTWA